jgi:hypothetical protein
VPVSKWPARNWPYVLIAIALVGLAYRIWVGSFWVVRPNQHTRFSVGPAVLKGHSTGKTASRIEMMVSTPGQNRFRRLEHRLALIPASR